MHISEMQQEIEKKFFTFSNAFELVALNTSFYRERILLISSQYVNSLKISDTTKTDFFQLKIFHSDEKKW